MPDPARMTDAPSDAEVERDASKAADWDIYENSVGGWYAWNSKLAKRKELVHRGSFSEAVDKFNDLFGDYYASRPGSSRMN